MKTLQALTQMDPRGIAGIFFDIDDTFSSGGKITKEAYAALWQLREARLAVIPITGRPAGWCDHIARMWPVSAVIGENGAFYFMMQEHKLIKRYLWDTLPAEKRRRKLDAIRDEVFTAYPHAGIASDQSYREFDLAIDFCEDVERLSPVEVQGIVSIFKKHGANVKVSSIHVNGWFGDYDKLGAAKAFARRELGTDLDAANKQFVFAGDSPNDEPLFGFFANSVGVGNVRAFAEGMKHLPSYITPSDSGAGFVELAQHLLR